jgi:arylsulfatase A-like enzyme
MSSQALLFACLMLAAGAAAGPPPHIVFFLADDLGWNDVSFHGSAQIATPTLDRLAAAGVALDRYYVNPVCSPTRASLMVGRSMMHTGIQTPYGAGDDASGLNMSYTTLPEQLKLRHNYTSYMVGKWHLGMKNRRYLPSARGFSKYYGYYLGCTDYWKHYGDLGDGGEIAVELHQGGQGLGLAPGEDEPLFNTSGRYSTPLYAQIAAEWIGQHNASASPMFLYLAFQGAHSANNKFVQAPAALLARDDIHAISPDKTCGQWELPMLNPATCDKVAMRKTIAATVVAIDEAVGVVEQALKDAGMWDNTLIVFSTDNGGPTDGTNNNMMNNFPLRSGKGETFEGGIRAVGFMHGAGLSPGVVGKTSSVLHHVSDWYKTLVAAADAADSDTAAAPLSLKPNERPFIDGDGLDNWLALSSPGHVSQRDEIFIAGQAHGSHLRAHALRWEKPGFEGMKVLYNPSLLYNMPGWYPPPGKAWNYSNTLTVKCGQPPALSSRAVNECRSGPGGKNVCLFNVTADPCEHYNIAEDYPAVVEKMLARIDALTKTTVLTWVNYSEKDNQSNPTHFGPTTPIVPDPQKRAGPHIYQGVWKPWLSDAQDAMYYPASYEGPGYPTKYVDDE